MTAVTLRAAHRILGGPAPRSTQPRPSPACPVGPGPVPRPAAAVLRRPYLSDVQLRVVRMLADGQPTTDIARTAGTGDTGIGRVIGDISRILGATSREHAVALAAVHRFVTADHLTAPEGPLRPLNPADQRVLQALVGGITVKASARLVSLAPQTIRDRRRVLRARVGARTNTELAVLGVIREDVTCHDVDPRFPGVVLSHLTAAHLSLQHDERGAGDA